MILHQDEKDINFICQMKQTKLPSEQEIIDQQYINNIYESLVSSMSVLDKLNTEFKVKQESHFIKTFMNVIEKIGNELILAQEAFRNIDLQVRKDSYCLQLAEELHFFKQESYNLKELLTAAQEQLKTVKFDKENIANDLTFTRSLYQQKTIECLALKSEVKVIKSQIKSIQKSFNYSSVLELQKNMNKDRREKESMNLPSASSSLEIPVKQFKSNAFVIDKGKDSMTIESSSPENGKRASLHLTLTSTPKGSLLAQKSVASTSRSFRNRNRLPEHFRILPEEYIPPVSS